MVPAILQHFQKRWMHSEAIRLLPEANRRIAASPDFYGIAAMRFRGAAGAVENLTGEWRVVTVHRGEIYYADLSPVVGSEQGGVRPVLIVQNDVGNRYSPTVIAAAITSQTAKTRLPTHININADSCGLSKNSVVLLEQIRTLDKRRLKERMGTLDIPSMQKVDNALTISFGLGLKGSSRGVEHT